MKFPWIGCQGWEEMDKSKILQACRLAGKVKTEDSVLPCSSLKHFGSLPGGQKSPASRASGTGGFHDDGYCSIETQQHREPSVQWL